MKIKIASYNISGGFFKENNAKDFLDSPQAENVDDKLIEEIIENINEENLDIICFQEIITTEKLNHIKKIMNKTNLKYEVHFELSPCHLVKNTDCGLAILSKYPIVSSQKKLFTNPKLSKTTSSGNTYYIYDKGYLMANINICNEELMIITHHGFPYHRFNSTAEENKNIFEEFDSEIKSLSPNIVTGDFNSQIFMNLMPYTKENFKRTINAVITADDILLKKYIKYNSKILKSLSDHYILIVEFEI